MPTDTGVPGATNLPPLEKYVAGRALSESQGGYKGYNISPGSDPYISAQLARINTLGAGSGTGGSTPTGSGTGGTGDAPPPTPTSPDLNTAYDTAMSKYLESLNPTAQETSDQAKLNALDASAVAGENGTRDKAIPMPFITGRLASQQRDYTAQRGVLANELSTATKNREIVSTGAKAKADYLASRAKASPADFNLSPGQTHYTYDAKTGKYVASAAVPANEPAGPSSVQEYEYAVKQGYKGSYTDYQNEDANRKARAAAGPTTVAEKQAATFGKIDTLLQPGKYTSQAEHIPYIDARGYLTKEGFNRILSAAREDGISRKTFLAEYANYLFPGDAGDYSGYNLTGAEVKLIAPY